MDDHRIAQPFHAGELRAQQLAGGGPAGAPIRARMPEQHRQFFPLLPFLCVAALDADAWPVASLLHGEPGFVSSPDPGRLHIAALPEPEDPIHACLGSGAGVGMLGIDLATRRRNRANGVVSRAGRDGLLVDLNESFGNCPKYIRVWHLTRVERGQGGIERFGAGLPAAAAAMIAACETMFVASASGEPAPSARLDISHRGGAAGFLRLQGNVLTIPDYAGNRYFNTLGNLLLEPRAALLMVDFDSGDLLQLQGIADVAPGLFEEEPAQRAWSFRIQRGCLRRAAFPLRNIA